MDALLKRASLIFDIPEGASLWEINDGPVVKLPNGDTFWQFLSVQLIRLYLIMKLRQHQKLM